MVNETSSDTALADRTCTTCGHSGPPSDFYKSSPECRKCKRNRSRTNRAVIADKVALADRLLALVERIAGGERQLCSSCQPQQTGTAPSRRANA